MNTKDVRRPYGPLFIDPRIIAALARRCARAMPVLPGLEDEDVRGFVRMARRVDPRPMLLDEDFALRQRFELLTAIVEPLDELVRCYGHAIDEVAWHDDSVSIYCEVLTLSVRTLCAGLELFAAARASVASAKASAHGAVADASRTFESELAVLLLRVTHVLGQPKFGSLEEADALARAVRCAMLQLPHSATRQLVENFADARGN